MLTQADIDYMRRTADEYDALLKRWTAAPAYSQEIANLHATFKARAGDVGRMVENGLFRRVLATLDAGVAPSQAPDRAWRLQALNLARELATAQSALDMEAHCYPGRSWENKLPAIEAAEKALMAHLETASGVPAVAAPDAKRIAPCADAPAWSADDAEWVTYWRERAERAEQALGLTGKEHGNG